MCVRLLGVTHFCGIFNIWLKPLPSQDARSVYKHSEAAAGVPSHILLQHTQSSSFKLQVCILLLMCEKLCVHLKSFSLMMEKHVYNDMEAI